MFRSIRLFIVLVLAVISMVFGSVQFALADPNPPHVGAHRHFIQQSDGTLVEVGPRVCDNPNLQGAFNQFHTNVHFPGAPGLTDHDHGPRIVGRGCLFVP